MDLRKRAFRIGGVLIFNFLEVAVGRRFCSIFDRFLIVFCIKFWLGLAPGSKMLEHGTSLGSYFGWVWALILKTFENGLLGYILARFGPFLAGVGA